MRKKNKIKEELTESLWPNLNAKSHKTAPQAAVGPHIKPQTTTDIESASLPLKLLICCQLFYPELISTGQTLTELCEVLSNKGVQIEVLCGQPTLMDDQTRVPDILNHHNILIKRIFSTRFSKLSFIGKLLNHITFSLAMAYALINRQQLPPVMVLTNPPFMAPIIALIHRFKKFPFIYLIFDVYPDTAIACGLLKANGLLARSWRGANQWIYSQADAIVVIGNCMQKKIMSVMKEADKSKVQVIPIWADDRQIFKKNITKNPIIQNWELEDKFVLLYAGNMGRFHDMETIIQSAIKLKDDPKIAFLFVGEGHQKKALENTAFEHKLTNCHFHSYVPRETLNLLYDAADAGLVSLNLGQEGFSVPSKALGIMAAGLPVLAIMSEESEIALIIKAYDCGIVVPPKNTDELVRAIKLLSQSKTQRTICGKNSLQAIKSRYNINHTANRYLEMIKLLQT